MECEASNSSIMIVLREMPMKLAKSCGVLEGTGLVQFQKKTQSEWMGHTSGQHNGTEVKKKVVRLRKIIDQLRGLN